MPRVSYSFVLGRLSGLLLSTIDSRTGLGLSLRQQHRRIVWHWPRCRNTREDSECGVTNIKGTVLIVQRLLGSSAPPFS